MALLYAEDPFFPAGRPVGFARYREVLERDWLPFFLGGFITLVSFLPFGLGMVYAIGSTSALVMLAAGLLGGAVAGPFVYALHDMVFRSLRDADTNWWRDYRRALRSGWRSALLPGAFLGAFAGCAVFMGLLLFWWRETLPGIGTTALFLVSLLLTTMLLSVYWPQLVLFEQEGRTRLRNCLLFSIRYFWHLLGVAAVQVGFWLIIVLFLPWSGFVVPFLNLWFVTFLTNFLLYSDLNEAFGIEEAIRSRFPNQILDREAD